MQNNMTNDKSSYFILSCLPTAIARNSFQFVCACLISCFAIFFVHILNALIWTLIRYALSIYSCFPVVVSFYSDRLFEISRRARIVLFTTQLKLSKQLHRLYTVHNVFLCTFLAISKVNCKRNVAYRR